jgi:hypothetical protein
MSAEQSESTWRKSSFSGNDTNCVEIGRGSEVVGVRDTKDPHGGTLLIARDAFAAFLRASVA